MRLVSIEIENFLSIEKAFIKFDDSGTLLIEGWNYDVDRANGAGKTAILNAIAFALYDKLPRKITSTEILRRGAKKGSVSLIIDCGAEILGVRRSRPKGVCFSHDVNGSSEELSITQQEFEAKLKLTYHQFIVAMYCSQVTSDISPRFLALNDTDKKQFLLQLLNLDEFAQCKKLVDQKIQNILIKTGDFSRDIAILDSKMDAYSESLIDENALRFQLQKKQESQVAFFKALQESQSVVKPDLTKYQQLEENILAKKHSINRAKTAREVYYTQWEFLSKKIKPFNPTTKCISCGSLLDTSHAEEAHHKETLRQKEELSKLKNQIDECDKTLLNESKIDELYSKLRERKWKESIEYDEATRTQIDLQAQLKMLSSDINDINEKLQNNNQLLERIKKISNERKEILAQIDILSKDLEIQKTVASIYSPTGAQAYILDSAVTLFNEQIAKYVSFLWDNLTYELQSYKETVKGDITAKFSESITMDGKSISLGSLSGGELKALSICADMALLGILEQQFGISMSPIIFDEAFDGLDTSGKEFALELINGLAKDRQVIVIDHASEMRTAFDKIIKVEKRNGISTVNTNP